VDGVVSKLGLPGLVVAGIYYGGKWAYRNGYIKPGSYEEATNGVGICFPKGTPILMANGTYRLIEEVQSGEYVVSVNLNSNSLETSIVKKTFIGKETKFVQYTTSDGDTLICTRSHPIYVVGKGWSSSNFTETNALYGMNSFLVELGDRCVLIRGHEMTESEIIGIGLFESEQAVYNLSIVVPNHNFIARKFLVHNSSYGAE
jgi:intein/homing endonuclease